MKKILFLTTIGLSPFLGFSQLQMNNDIANELAKLPLKCIQQEYPNKTAHVINNANEVPLTPAQLHPSFYGCFDWHSSVHGHWMLVKLLKEVDVNEKDKIIQVLSESFKKDNIQVEADYFSKYKLASIFERTYGWAWLLKLDQELYEWNTPIAKEWRNNLRPLTQVVVQLWKEYLPKQTYPNRTGVHGNAAFGLSFALDWARSVGDAAFEQQIVQKSLQFYKNDKNTPAYLEPDGADFFSPSLMIAELMSKIVNEQQYPLWFDQFYSNRSLDNISKDPIISDRMDYQITHLDGLLLSRAWNMRVIAKKLGHHHPIYNHFNKTSDIFLKEALENIKKGNYGGEHWLGSFAVYALYQ